MWASWALSTDPFLLFLQQRCGTVVVKRMRVVAEDDLALDTLAHGGALAFWPQDLPTYWTRKLFLMLPRRTFHRRRSPLQSGGFLQALCCYFRLGLGFVSAGETQSISGTSPLDLAGTVTALMSQAMSSLEVAHRLAVIA